MYFSELLYMSIFVHPSSVWQYQINYSELEHSNHIIWHHIYNIEIKPHVQSRSFPQELVTTWADDVGGDLFLRFCRK